MERSLSALESKFSLQTDDRSFPEVGIDFCHPCQVLADLMTVREHKGHLDGLKMCYIGDGNNMANSLIVGGLKTGMQVSVACPEGYRPDSRVLDFANNYAGFSMFTEPMEAASGADVIFTDVWASMGQEGEALSLIHI